MPMRSAEIHTRITSIASLFLVFIGILVLTGWMLDVSALKGIGGAITMKANAAIGLLASGLALRLLRTRRLSWARFAGITCALIAGTLGALTLSEHLIGWNLGIDELLFTETAGAAATMSPGRMGPNASLSLTASGIALISLYRNSRRPVMLAQLLGGLVTVLALVPIVGYLYGAAQLYAVARYTGIAPHTGISLLVLGVGILAARLDTGPVAALVGEAPHAVMARRLLAVAIALPLTLGYVRILGERGGWYDSAFGASVMVVVTIVMLSITIWRTAVAHARSEEARAHVQQHRDDLLVSERTAREEAERAGRAKDEFIAALSHELRTPLNAILGWMQMLQRGALPEASRAKATEAVTRNAGLLARLIEDLLDTSRITTGQLQLSKTPVDINAVAAAAAESVLPAAEARDVTISVLAARDAPLVIGDSQRLQQVLWNLLSNAIKFSAHGARVTVQVQVEDNGVSVHVRDEGEGIDPAFLPHIFDQFRRDGDSSSQGMGGLGLGLYIAKHLTELHGGTIEAHSDGLGRGALFTLRLPVGVEAGVSSTVA